MSMRFALIALILAAPSWAADAHQLTENARQMLREHRSRGDAEAVLQQAIAENPNDAEPLTLFAVLRHWDLKDNPDSLRVEVQPLFEKLLIMRRQNPDTKPGELALAYELNALLLDQLGDAARALPLKEQALAIRKQIVVAMQQNDAAPMPPAERVSTRLGVSAPSVLQKKDPEYAEDARLEKVTGTVLVSTVIGTDGIPRSTVLIRSLGFGLDEKAVEALSTWRFKPGLKDGLPVPVKAQIEINFRLL